MAIKPELESWIKALPEDTQKLLRPELEKDEVQKIVSETVMLRSDYSRNLDQSKKEVESAKLAAAQQAEAAKQGYDQFRQVEQERVNKYVTDTNQKLIQQQNQLKAYEDRLGSLVNQGLITQEEAAISKQDFIIQQQNQPVVQQPDRKYVSEEVLRKTSDELKGYGVSATAVINDIADAHFDLFGQRLSREELVAKTYEVNEKRRLLKQPEMKVAEVWRAIYDVDKKREELQKTSDDARIKAAVDEALVKDRSERAIAGDSAPFSGLNSNGDKHLLEIFSSQDGKARSMGVSATVAKVIEARRNGTLGKSLAGG